MFSAAASLPPFASDPNLATLRECIKFNGIDEYAQDFGGMVRHKPLAVFLPKTIQDLQSFLTIANTHKIKVLCRGKGNSAFGQAQIADGVIIDLKNLDYPVRFNNVATDSASITVPAFKTWQETVELAKNEKLTIPVTIDNLDLTIGGTLSFAALGGSSYYCGSGADNILSLSVVTMDGKYHICTPTKNEELFNAVLCGMGQFGIIISAEIPLVVAKENVRVYFLSYSNPRQFFYDQKQLYKEAVFDHLKGFIRKVADKWEYVIEAAAYLDTVEGAGVKDALAKLTPEKTEVKNQSYWGFINDVTNFVKSLRDSGSLNAPHPWYNVLMPEVEIASHLQKVLEMPGLSGADPVFVYPMNSEKFKRPLFMKPQGEIFYLLGVLYNTSPVATKNFPVEVVLANNKKLYREASAKGGYRYPVDAMTFTMEDWAVHYREKWMEVRRLKEKYDPEGLLAGVGAVEENKPTLRPWNW